MRSVSFETRSSYNPPVSRAIHFRVSTIIQSSQRLLISGVVTPHFNRMLSLQSSQPNSLNNLDSRLDSLDKQVAIPRILASRGSLLSTLLRPAPRSHLHDFLPNLSCYGLRLKPFVPSHARSPHRLFNRIPKSLTCHQDRVFKYIASQLSTLSPTDKQLAKLYKQVCQSISIQRPWIRTPKLIMDQKPQVATLSPAPKPPNRWSKFKSFIKKLINFPISFIKLLWTMFKR